jgi:ribosomal protein RSM22 (predicted rRNA methylase)
MSAELPPALRAAADRLLEGASRQRLAQHAAKISAQYRAGGASHSVVTSAEEATAYALTRLPATFAACLHALTAAQELAPGFSPLSLLDAGAGPGAASWAASEVWGSLQQATFLDSNPTFLSLAATLAADGPAALRNARPLRADLAAPADWPQAELVVASYALAEVRPDRLDQALDALWAAAGGLLVIVEPGSPAGFARVLAARSRLIAAGARIAAPCPHEAPCPLADAAPDWCHFSQRLPRSRDHRVAKGAEVPYEDEKFIYLAAARPGVALAERTPRILAPPRSGKPGIELKLCTAAGLDLRFVAKRDKAAHAGVRRLGWGDRLP